jgi:hypothetical protein
MTIRHAEFSPCRTWRYSLSRMWTPGAPLAMFVGLNPSAADEIQDDPTARKCMRFAESYGYGGIILANLFAYWATDPRKLKVARNPVGPDNDHWLTRLADEARIIIAAWGACGSFMGRDCVVMDLLGEVHCLGFTKEGRPRHPLYLKSDCRPGPFMG